MLEVDMWGVDLRWDLVMGSLAGPMTREGWGVVGEGLIS